MNLTNRVKTIENHISMNENLFPEVPDFDNMPENELNEYLFRALLDEIKTIKPVCRFNGIELKDRESFIRGLKLFKEKYISDEGKKFYTDEMINFLGEVFQENKEKLASN